MTDDGIEVPEELKKLENIDGLSLSEGMYYCGSSKAYIKFLNTFFMSFTESVQNYNA